MSQVATKSILDNAVTEPKLSDTGVTAGTYVGNLRVGVTAKGRVVSISPTQPTVVTATGQAQAFTNLTVMTGMTFTPPAGVYEVEFTGSITLNGSTPSGTLGIYKNGVAVDYSVRNVSATVTTLQLLVQVNVGTITLSNPVQTKAWVTCNGTDVITLQWIANSGNVSVGPRAFVLVQVG